MTYTEEEIAQLPQIDAVFDKPPLVIDEHEWIQEGYMVHDRCNPAKPTCQTTGLPIPHGKLLIKKDGAYDIVDEPR